VRLIEDAGRRAVTVPGDLRDEATCQRVVDTAVREFGRIDVLVSNAANQMSQDGGIADSTTEQFDRVMKTNVYAMFWLAKAAIPHMSEGSSIITTSSVQGFSPSPHLLDYATSKAAIVNFTKGLAADVVEKGIRVNSVAPGPVWTPLIPATMDKDKVESFGAQSPSRRAARRAGPELRVPRLAGVELHHRRRHRGDGRVADRLTRRRRQGRVGTTASGRWKRLLAAHLPSALGGVVAAFAGGPRATRNVRLPSVGSPGRAAGQDRGRPCGADTAGARGEGTGQRAERGAGRVCAWPTRCRRCGAGYPPSRKERSGQRRHRHPVGQPPLRRDPAGPSCTAR
jgi:NAD(P)-dependent dehydrogenase (short-subunit alcohol dehydrogenase family)